MTKAFKKHSIWGGYMAGFKGKPKTYEQRGKNNRYNRYYTWLFNGGKNKERMRITSSGNMMIGV